MARPECYEFAMQFIGGKEEKEVRAYVEQIEQALQKVLDCAEIGVVQIYYLDNLLIIKSLLEPEQSA